MDDTTLYIIHTDNYYFLYEIKMSKINQIHNEVQEIKKGLLSLTILIINNLKVNNTYL